MTNAELFNLHSHLTHSLRLVQEEIQSRDIDWRHLVENGLIIEAIKALRKHNPALSLKEAKDCVDAFRAM